MNKFALFAALPALLLWTNARELNGQSFVIEEIQFEISGSTKAGIVRNYLQIEEEMRFPSKENFLLFLAEKEQMLENARVFRSSAIHYTLYDSAAEQEDEEIAVTLTVIIQDGWTFYPIPIYTYNSSVGHTFLGVVFDTNFFGTMSSIKLRTLYNRETLAIDLTAEKIRVFHVPWRIIGGYEYLEQLKLKNNETSLHFDTKTIWFGIGAEIPLITPFHYSFFPSIETRFDYHIHEGTPDQSFEPEGITLLYEHYAGFDTINWQRNFRRGLSGKVQHSIGYAPNTHMVTNRFSPEFIAHIHLDPFGMSTRMTGFYWIGVERTGAGEELRGIIDNSIWGDFGAYWNIDIGLRIISIKKVLDIHVNGFFDLGIVKPADTEITVEKSEYTAGLGLVVYPNLAPGTVIRFYYGFDLKRAGNGEFIFTFEEFY